MRFPFQIFAIGIVAVITSATDHEKEISLILHDLEDVLQPSGSVANGNSCSSDSDCVSGRCIDSCTFCFRSNSVCHAKVPDGDECNEDNDCESGRCDQETNLSIFTSVCHARVADGDECNEDSDCESGDCSAASIFNPFGHSICHSNFCGGATGAIDFITDIGSTIIAFSPSSQRLLGELDHHTFLVASQGASSILGTETKMHTDIDTSDVDLGWSKPSGSGFAGPWTPSPPPVERIVISDGFSYDSIREDDFFGDQDSFFDVNTILSSILFPLADTTVYAEPSEIQTLMRDLNLHAGEGGAFPITYNVEPFDMVSDESFSRVFFYGMGIPLIAQQDDDSLSEFGPFEVDMPLQNLETRERYRPLGARVHFDQNQKATAIHDYFMGQTYRPGDEGWEEAKFNARVTATTLVTVREHLTWTHLIVSQSATVYSTLALPPNHPLRRLLTIHTYRATTVNIQSEDNLSFEKGILHRGVGITHDALKQVFELSYQSSNIYEPFVNRNISPALQALVDAGKFPFISEGISYYNIVKEFVTEWITRSGDAAGDSQALDFYNRMRDASIGQSYEIPVYTGTDSMIDLITQVIFSVTAWHELVGYVRDFDSPRKGGIGRVSPYCDDLQSDVQNFLLATIVSASTSLTMPFLMRDYPNYFSHGGAPAWEREVWDNFKGKLELQSADVVAADAERMRDPEKHEFKHMDPARFESSVSV